MGAQSVDQVPPFFLFFLICEYFQNVKERT